MTEKLLQYLWNFKLFKSFNFKDTNGKNIEIVDFGTWNHNSGPDFLMAKIKTDGLLQAGHIELHLKSSDWVFHRHSEDPAFQNIILHAVLYDDAELPELSSKQIPTLELHPYIDTQTLSKYESLLAENHFIACEKIFEAQKIPFHFCEETLLKKLDQKATEIAEQLLRYKNDFEAVLFHQLAYAFGLKVNAAIFRQIAESISFGIVRKISRNRNQLEAFLFGKAGWLQEAIDAETEILKKEYDFLKMKYQISDDFYAPNFLRLRPPGFPTLRLSQLAHLYSRESNMFSKILEAEKKEDLSALFSGITASAYWDTHYNFGKKTDSAHPKNVTPEFTDLVLLNAVLPLKYACQKHLREDIADHITQLYRQAAPEKNQVLQQWKKLGVPIRNALESQSYIYHYSQYCSVKNCLNCSIGFQLLKPYERTQNHQ